MIDMPENKIYRLSLVKMYYAKIKKKETPDPFCEIRAFTFLPYEPTTTLQMRIKKELENAIHQLIVEFLPHIFFSEKNEFYEESKEELQSILVKKLTEQVKIEIDGWEVEEIDIDEIMKDYLIGGEVRHWFRQDRAEKKKFRLNFGIIYRYVAFFDEEGNIKGEYDEWDIRKKLEELRSLILQRLKEELKEEKHE